MVSAGAVHRPGSYRPEIDGLRAVAVVPVVLFHAHVPGVSGGFVGVDVFFVISGFLITSHPRRGRGGGTLLDRHLLRAAGAADLSGAVRDAGGERARWRWRCCCRSSSRLRGEPRGRRRSSSRTSTSCARPATSSPPPSTKPLLHTWSLAIEEQFYIFFPLYLYAMSRWAPRWLLPVTAAVLLAVAGALHRDDPSAERRGVLLHAGAGLGAAGRVGAGARAAAARCPAGWRRRSGRRGSR